MKVNGPIYAQIVQGKDLVADILPPPEYILETHLVAHQLRFATTAAEKEALIKRLGELKNDFETRQTYWKQANLDPALQKPFFEEAYGGGKRYYQKLDAEFVPAVRAGDVRRMEGLLGELSALYDAHRKGIDATVEIANKGNSRLEANAAELDRSVIIAGLAAFALALTGVLAIVFRISSRLLSGLGGEPAVAAQIATRIAAGDLTMKIDLQPGYSTSLMASMAKMQRDLVERIDADVSHESIAPLRSPEMQVRVEIAAGGNVRRDRPTMRAACAAIPARSSRTRTNARAIQQRYRGHPPCRMIPA